MRRTSSIPAGEVRSLYVDSEALKANLLGDPTRRRIDVYRPHGSDGQGLPLLVDLVGFTAGGPAHTNWKNFGENVPERLDRLIADGWSWEKGAGTRDKHAHIRMSGFRRA